MIYPKFPKSGDVIGICAPSAGAGSKLDSFDLSLDTLHELGFETYETESVRADGCPSAPADQRGYEFNSLFADPDISMVMSASGGDYTMEMLPYIDRKLQAIYDTRDAIAFGRKGLLNVAAAGKFSSDRTIKQYAEEIWRVKPVTIPETEN